MESCANRDPGCSCQFQVHIHPRGRAAQPRSADTCVADLEKDVDSPLLALLLRKLPQGRKAMGLSLLGPQVVTEAEVPLVRLGRDAEVKEALQGRPLLQCLQQMEGAAFRVEWRGGQVASKSLSGRVAR